MKTLHKLLIGSALIVSANLAGAQATNTATMPGSPPGPVNSTTMPAAGMPAMGAPTADMPATTSGTSATAPGSATTGTSATSPDPFVQKRNTDKAAKTDYREKKAASKAEYKEEKRAAKSELKAEKRDAKQERNMQLSTQPKTDLPGSETGK